MPPTQMPLRFEAASLSRMRSPVTSRSNWAKDNSMLRVSLPMLVRAVEGLGDRDERDPVGIEDLDELGEVGERAGQPVDLVDHHHIDEPRADRCQEPLQSRPLERSTREAAIVEALLDQAPALLGLALHVSSPGLALRIERVEVLLEAVLGRHTGVDGAAQRLRTGFDHRPQPFWSRRPKKRGPFQRVPVIARATLERLG